MRLDNVRLLVDDVARAFRYYRDVFGFEPHVGGENEQVFASLGIDDHVDIGLYARGLQSAADGAMPNGDRSVIVIAVEDVDVTAATLARRGADVVAGPTDTPWGKIAHVRDPEGNLIELLGRPG